MKEAAFPLFTILAVLVFCTSITHGRGMQHVTYGSTVKLVNVDMQKRLHSHDIKYGSGSGQQSVTGIETKNDGNSYWLVKGETRKPYVRGALIECGSTIRLEHLETKKNLHSHHVRAPLSHGKQEVSAFGDSKGEGDNGDHWIIECSGDFWKRDKPVLFQHVDTDAYLAATGNVYGGPIHGQIEVVGDEFRNSPGLQWIAAEGVFIHPNDFKAQHNAHTEL